jgi:hypothetical protein
MFLFLVILHRSTLATEVAKVTKDIGVVTKEPIPIILCGCHIRTKLQGGKKEEIGPLSHKNQHLIALRLPHKNQPQKALLFHTRTNSKEIS